MTKLAELEIPALEGGWINLTEAAERLGVTRSYMYKKASKYGTPGGFETIRKIGAQASYVIKASEIDDILASAAREAEEKTQVEEAEPDPVVEKTKAVRKPRAKKEKTPVEVSIDKGLAESAAGEVEDLGSFTQFTDAEIYGDDTPVDPFADKEPMGIVTDDEPETPIAEPTEEKEQPKELSIDDILAQI